MNRIDRMVIAFIVAIAFASGTIPITLVAVSVGGRTTFTADVCHPNQSPDLPAHVTPAPPAATSWFAVAMTSSRFTPQPSVARAPRPADQPESPPPESFA